MFKSPKALDKVAHASLRFTPAKDMAFAREVTAVPLMANEIGQASLYYPIMFSLTEPAQPLAILGLTENNVFLDEQDRWTVPYIPLHIQRYPFIFGKTEDDSQYVVMIDEDAPQFANKDGEPLFDEKGEPSEHTQKNFEFLKGLEQLTQASVQLYSELETAGVLAAKEITIESGNVKRMIGGFRTIDDNKVAALDDATLARWARNGLLALIYAVNMSMRHLNNVAIASTRPEQVQ